MDINQELDRLTIRLALEFNTVKTTIGGDLSNLSTTDKTSIIAAINELEQELINLSTASQGLISDSLNASLTKVWSITKIKSYTDNLFNSLWTNVPSVHDNLMKISQAITDLEISSRAAYVPYDADISGNISSQEKEVARINIDAIGPVDMSRLDQLILDLTNNVGDTDFDFVSYFNSQII